MQGQKKNPQEQEIETILHKAMDLLTTYQKPLMIAGAVLVALLMGMGGISVYRSGQEKKAAPLVAEAYEHYSPANMAAADYGKALELFRNVQKKYSSTMSGAVAQYYVGNCLANLGRHDEAVKEYQSFLNQYSGSKLLASLVYLRLGYVYRSLGRMQDAEKAFDQSEALGGPGVATVEIARLQEATGNVIGSQQKYKVIQEKMGGTSWGVEAMGKLQVLTPAVNPAPGKEPPAKP